MILSRAKMRISVLLFLLTASASARITTSKIGDFPPLRVQALVGTREQATGHTGYHKEICKVTSVETIQLPAVGMGGRREFNFHETSLKFDGDRDSSNVGGEVYETFICGIRDPTNRSLIYFYSPDFQLANYGKAHPEKRDEFLSISKGSSLPSDLK